MATQPYHPRCFRRLGVWSVEETVFKVTGITKTGAPDVAAATLEAARVFAHKTYADMKAPSDNGAGYAILHAGDMATWLVLHWWGHDDIAMGVVASSSGIGPFLLATAHPFIACVWEQVVIAHERDAWVRHMLTTTPLIDAYLSDFLPDGDY